MRYLLILLLASSLLGCGGPRLPYLGENPRILAFGDSLTQGVGASSGMDYPSRLARLCQCEVVNAGLAGETSAEGLARLPGVMDATEPDLLLLLEGGNDVLRGLDQKALKANLASMITEAKRRNVPVMLVAVPDKGVWLRPLPLYGELAEEFDLPVLDDTVAQLLGQPGMKSDTVHFNDAGYHELALQIHRLAAERGAFEAP